jgi:hypothetical protein
MTESGSRQCVALIGDDGICMVTSRTANAIATQMVPASIDVFMIECFLYTCIAVEQLIGPRGIATGDVLAAVVGFASR